MGDVWIGNSCYGGCGQLRSTTFVKIKSILGDSILQLVLVQASSNLLPLSQLRKLAKPSY